MYKGLYKMKKLSSFDGLWSIVKITSIHFYAIREMIDRMDHLKALAGCIN